MEIENIGVYKIILLARSDDLPFDRARRIREARQWCEDLRTELRDIGWICHFFGSEFNFQRKEDAVEFKLMFG